MHYGEIIEQGTPDEVLNNPKTTQLREYLIEGN